MAATENKTFRAAYPAFSCRSFSFAVMMIADALAAPVFAIVRLVTGDIPLHGG